MESPKSVGRFPVMLLDSRFRVTRVLRLPSPAGIGPVIWLKFKFLTHQQ